MKTTIELKKYQKIAAQELIDASKLCLLCEPKALTACTLDAPTGSGKTIILGQYLEDLFTTMNGDQKAIVFWLSNQPSLNRQSRDKLSRYFKFNPEQLIELDHSIVAVGETLESGNVYFLNFGKAGDDRNLMRGKIDAGNKGLISLIGTAKSSGCHIIFVIDEAHTGTSEYADGKKIKKEETILEKLVAEAEPDMLIGVSATPKAFTNYCTTALSPKYIHREFKVELSDVQSDRMLKLIVENASLSHSKDRSIKYHPDIFTAAVVDYYETSQCWAEIGYKQPPVFLIQIDDDFEKKEHAAEFDHMLSTLTTVPNGFSTSLIESANIYHTFTAYDGNKDVATRRLSVRLHPSHPEVKYIEPEEISTNDKAKVVFFKDRLSQGFDCPNAEILFSVATRESETAIIQLVGRILRNPFSDISWKSVWESTERLQKVTLYTMKFQSKILDSIKDLYGTSIQERLIGTANCINIRVEVLQFFEKHPDIFTLQINPDAGRYLDDKISKLYEEMDSKTSAKAASTWLESALIEFIKESNVTPQLIMEILNEKIIRGSINLSSLTKNDEEKLKPKNRNTAEIARTSKSRIDSILSAEISEHVVAIAKRISIKNQSVLANTDWASDYPFTKSIKFSEGTVNSLIINPYPDFPEYSFPLQDFWKLVLIAANRNHTLNIEKRLIKKIEIELSIPTEISTSAFTPRVTEHYSQIDGKIEVKQDGTILKPSLDRGTFLVIDPRSAYSIDSSSFGQAMRLNSTERSILEKHLLTKKGHNFFWRNPSSFAGLGIQYSKSGKYHIYRPDFLSIKNAGPLELNDEFWLYEPKGENQSDWKEKLTGLLQWKDKVEALAASQKRRLKVNISWFIQINKKQVVLLETSPSEPGYTPLSLAVISGITDLSSLQNLGSLPGLFKSISV